MHEFFVLESGELRVGPPNPRDDGVAEPVYSPQGPRHPSGDRPDRPGARNAPDRGSDGLRLDRDTDMEGWLTYYAVFDPTVAPFKRVGVRDRVALEDGEIILEIGDPELAPVRLADAEPDPTSQVFWGSLLVELQPGLLVPIPSVAPTMAIHRVQTDPTTQVRFYKDGADNYMVGGDYAGVVQLDFLVSAPTSYFAGPLPTAGLLSEMPPRERRVDWESLPDSVRQPAQELFDLLGLSEQMPVAELVWNLAGHLRAFVAEPFPLEEWSDDVYRDILFGGRGVCRHRAFAFVVTLQAWGIEARYVHNEAHAFAEVFIPGNGWRRVDLGGGAQGLHVLNAASRVMHAPSESDPFPTPPEYVENYSERVRDELSRREIERTGPPSTGERRGDGPERSGDLPERSGDLVERSGETGERSDDPIEMPPWDPFEEHSVDLEASLQAASTSEGATDTPIAPPSTPRSPTLISVDAVQPEVYRGGDLLIEGRLRDASGAGLAEMPVHVFIAPGGAPNRDRWAGQVVELGTLLSGVDGRVRGSLAVPHSLPLGVWDVYLVFAGDAVHAPSRAR